VGGHDGDKLIRGDVGAKMHTAAIFVVPITALELR
jgi:hypothetical protein